MHLPGPLTVRDLAQAMVLRLGHMEVDAVVPWGRLDHMDLPDLKAQWGRARASHALCNLELSLLIRLIPALCRRRDNTHHQGSRHLANATYIPNIKAKPSKMGGASDDGQITWHFHFS